MRQEIITILVVAGTALFGYLDSRSKRKSKSSPATSGSASATRKRPLYTPPSPRSVTVPAAGPLPEEGVRVTSGPVRSHLSAPGSDSQQPAVTDDATQALAEHRMRWRKALIDSEILKTKF